MEELEQEINLREYVNVIIKRKWIILTIFFVSVIATAIVSFLQPRIYMATAIIQNAHIDEPLIGERGAIKIIDKPLIQKKEIEEIIKSQVLLNPVIKKLKLETDTEELRNSIVVEDIKDTDFFKLKVEYEGQDMAFMLCQAIANSYLVFGDDIYQKRIKLISDRLKGVDKQIDNIQNDIQHIRESIKGPFNSEQVAEMTSAPKVIFLQEALSNYQIHLSFLINQRNNLYSALTKVKEFKVINPPIRQKNPIRPKKRQNVVIAGVVSLIFGTFLAFFTEYWEKSK